MAQKVSCSDNKYLETCMFFFYLSKFDFNIYDEESQKKLLDHYIHLVSCGTCREGYEPLKELRISEMRRCGYNLELFARNEDVLEGLVLPSLISLIKVVDKLNENAEGDNFSPLQQN